MKTFLSLLRELFNPTVPPGAVCVECKARPACVSYGRGSHFCNVCHQDFTAI